MLVLVLLVVVLFLASALPISLTCRFVSPARHPALGVRGDLRLGWSGLNLANVARCPVAYVRKGLTAPSHPEQPPPIRWRKLQAGGPEDREGYRGRRRRGGPPSDEQEDRHRSGSSGLGLQGFRFRRSSWLKLPKTIARGYYSRQSWAGKAGCCQLGRAPVVGN